MISKIKTWIKKHEEISVLIFAILITWIMATIVKILCKIYDLDPAMFTA